MMAPGVRIAAGGVTGAGGVTERRPRDRHGAHRHRRSGAAVTGVTGAASAGRGRGTDAVADEGTLARGGDGLRGRLLAPLNIGAGCGPACISSTLIRIAMVTPAQIATATVSRRLQPSFVSFGLARCEDYALFFTGSWLRVIGGAGRQEARPRSCRPPDAAPGSRGPAIERQADADAGALPQPAADIDPAAVQRDQPLDDGQAEPGAVVTPVVARARLEERIADAGEIVVADADAGVLDGEHDDVAVDLGADRNLAAGMAELDRVRQQIEHDLVERALVGDDVRQLWPGAGRRARCRHRAPSAPGSRSSPRSPGSGAKRSGRSSKLPVSIFDMSRMPLTTDNR